MAVSRPAPRPPLLDEALAHGCPIVVFDGVHLAFDDKVILRDVSFTLQTGHTKIFLGASGAGKSTILRLMLGLLKPDAGEIFVNGERVDNMSEDDLRATVERAAGQATVEASGGVNLETVRGIAETGVDYISVGALTHSARALDLSLLLYT